MQATRASLFNTLTKAIHQPVLDKQRVTKLLHSLNKSLQDQLSKQAVRSSQALEVHFENILQNPLLAISSQGKLSSPLTFSAFDQMQKSFSHGDLNKDTVAQFLHQLIKSPRTNATTGLASKLWKQLAFGHSNILESLNRTSQHQLIRLLVRDDDHATARQWILNTTSPVLFPYYIESSIAENNISFAFAAAHELLLQDFATKMPTATVNGLIVLVAHLLGHVSDAAEITLEHHQTVLAASKQLANKLGKTRPHFSYASLALLNPDPTLCDPKPALLFLKKSNLDELKYPRAKVHMLQLSLKLAEQLMNKTNYAEASWVLNFAQQTFPDELGLTSQRTTKARPSQHQQADVLSRLGGILST